jgi:uncharacterized protein YggE
MIKLLSLTSLIAALLAGAVAAAGASAAPLRTITVNGSGIITTVPNEADFSFGVSVTASTAKAALAANATRMNAVIAAIKKQGIPDREIQTQEVSLTPNTNDSDTRIVNFTAENSVSVTTKQIAKAGALIDASVAAGANTVDGPNLTQSDLLSLQQRALAAAVAVARARAQAIAAAAHVSLGRVLTVTENSSSPVVYNAAPVTKAAGSATPVEPGTVQTEEDVTVTFAIS